jgi:hypothetical protein
VLSGAVLLLAIIGAFYYFVDIRGRATAVQEEAASRRLVADFDRQAVRSITIEPADGPLLKVYRNGVEAAWRIESPEALEADPDVIQQLLETLGRLSAEDEPFPPGGDGLVPYGLAPPRLKVTVSGEEGGRLARLALGGAAPFGSLRYAEVRDTGDVGQVSLAEVEAVPGTLFDLREKRLVRFRREEVRELRVEVAQQPALVIRRQGDNWDIAEPLEFAADRQLVGNLIWELTECQAIEFPGEAETADLLASPTIRIGLTMADGSEVGARFGALAESGDGVLAAGDLGTAMKVETTILESALRPANRWRELRPFPRYSWEVDGLTVTAAGSDPVAWRRAEDGVWQVEGGLPEGRMVPEETIRQALDLLTGLKACGLSGIDDAGALEAAALEEPAFTVTITGGAGEVLTVESLELGFPDRAAALLPDSCSGAEPLLCGIRPDGFWIYIIDEPGREELRAILETLSAGGPGTGGPSAEEE